MKSLIFAVLLIFLPCIATAKNPIRTVEGYVTKVVDGDTINVNSDGTRLKIRLYGIDAPETEKRNRKTGLATKEGQAYGDEALKALLGKVDGQKVFLNIMDIDRYRRMVSIVFLGSRNINREMVAEGWAWAYRKYLEGTYASEFMQDEEDARKKRLGLWRQYNPQPPWEFRKSDRMQLGIEK